MRKLLLILCSTLLIFLTQCQEVTPPTGGPQNPGTSPPKMEAIITSSAVGGSWQVAGNWPVHVAIHAHLLPNGRVLFWPGEEGPRKGSKGSQQAFVWDPITATSISVPNTRTDVFCSGHAFLPDGRLLVVGGHTTDGHGRKDASFFSFASASWSRANPMNAGRWYPSATALTTGEILVIGGTDENGNPNRIPQVWKSRGGWRTLTGVNLVLPYYPRTFALSDGRTYYVGESRNTGFLDPRGAGTWIPSTNRVFGDRNYGSAVLYGPDKILYVGGGDPPTATAETIDLSSGGSGTWQFTGSMGHPRRQLNATLLADGTVLATGGTSSAGFNDAGGAVLEAELWNPSTGQWTPMASMSENRLYHSIALLLPDARVLSAGGGRPAATNDQTGDAQHNHPTAEIYSPPYLFNSDGSAAERPQILSAPSSVAYGQAFSIQISGTADIAKITWIRLSSVSHSNNMDQRINFLNFSSSPNGSALNVTVTAPLQREAPPGHYMLFVLNASGVPSVSRIVRIG